MKKTMVLLLCFVITSWLAGCNKADTQKDYGEIQNIEVSGTAETIYEEDKIFTEAKDNLGYEYVEVDSKRAEMKFMIPKTWNIKKVNHRFIKIESPEDDPLLPGITLNIQHGFSPLAEYDKNTPSDFEELFSAERKIITYKIDGREYSQSYMSTPSRVVTHSEITTEPRNICMYIYENAPIFLYHRGDVAPYECTAFYSYVKWQNLPHCFSMVCNSKYADAAEKLLTYITSTIKLSKAKIGKTKQEDISGVTFIVPEEFERVKRNGNEHLIASTADTNYFGGCAISVVDLGNEKVDKEYADKFMAKDGPGENLCKEIFGSAYQYVLGYWSEPEKVHLGGNSADLLRFTCDIFGTCSINDPMQPVTNSYLYLYCFDNPKGGKKAVFLLTGSTPENALIALANMIEERTKIT